MLGGLALVRQILDSTSPGLFARGQVFEKETADLVSGNVQHLAQARNVTGCEWEPPGHACRQG